MPALIAATVQEIELPNDDTTVTEAAVMYAALGFQVVPLHGVVDGRCTCGPTCTGPGKHPISSAWQKRATSEPDEAREMFRGHRWNIGLMLGHGLVALDIDGSVGFESLATLGDLPRTLSSVSGSGVGEHRIFAYAPHHDPSCVSNRKVLPKLDLRTREAQIVVAPSLHVSGRRYRWIDRVAPAVLPDHLYEAIRKKPASNVLPIDSSRSPAQSRDVLARRARSYIAKIPPAVSGEGGHDQTFSAALWMVAYMHKGLPEQEAWSLLCEYNGTCRPPWQEHELRHKFEDAKKAHTIPEIPDRDPVRPEPPRPDPAGAPAANVVPIRDDSDDWKAKLIWESNKKGIRAAKHPGNAIVIARYDPAWRGRIRFNQFAQCVTVDDPPWHEADRPDSTPGTAPWTDVDSVRLSGWIRRNHQLDISSSDCEKAVEVVAQSNRYHPVRDFFDGLVWDGQPRLRTACQVYLGAAPTLFTELVFRWWTIAAVARTYDPGCKADNVLILEGEQGLRKSSALRTLAGPEWFSDTPIDLQSKDAYIALCGKLIIELAELESLRRTDASRAKSFFSSTADSFRPPYGKRTITVPRTCVFAGSVNHASYLQDSTGNRRYWPIACTSVDLEAIARDREQLWAEAVAAYHDGAKWWPTTPEELDACEEAQAPRGEADEWETVIAAWVATHPDACPNVGEILEDVFGIPKDKWIRPDQMRVSSVLQRLGFVKFQSRENERRVWRYRKSPLSQSRKAG